MNNLMKQMMRRGLALVTVVAFTSTLVVFVPAVEAGGHRDNGPVMAGGDTQGVGGRKIHFTVDGGGGSGNQLGGGASSGNAVTKPATRDRSAVLLWDAVVRMVSFLVRR